MQQYIALLRGINVGGKNKPSMKELKQALEDAGFQDVVTYINSGNIIFSSEQRDRELIQKRVASLIRDAFRIEVTVLILAAEELKEALDHAPDWWGADQESKHNALFVIPPVTAAEVFREVGELKPEYEKVSSFGRVIFWSAPLKTFSRTRWSQITGKSVYNSITIRNANTAKKLRDLSLRNE